MNTTNKKRINLHRLFALIFALLFITMTLYPSLSVKASDDDWTSAGAGDKVGSSSGADESDTNNFDSNFSFEGLIHYIDDRQRDVQRSASFYFSRSSHMNIRTVKLINNGLVSIHVFFISDDLFTGTYGWNDDIINGKPVENTHRGGTLSCNSPSSLGGKKCYYAQCALGAYPADAELSFPNIITIYGTTIDHADVVKDLDLTKDDWKGPDENSAVYYKDLDFASISADYKVKYTIEKNNEGKFEFITPDEAGIQFDWINREDIDGAYVKFTIYGEYNDSFWGTSSTKTYVTLTCLRKNDLSYLCRQKEMIALAKEKCNGSKGWGFPVNYIYVQAFANIDGTMCRSRIYKFDADLVSDYGNADSEDDEWVPEITGGDSMPEDYKPDLNDVDPEKKEPKPDDDDDTIIDTPISDDDNVVINDDTTYLEAFKQFISVMKQGISYLGDFPLLVSKVFSFIPSVFLVFIGVGFAVALILRFLGR